jgi:hypothetical protein
MTVQERIDTLRTWRERLDAIRPTAPPEQWAGHDAWLQMLERDLDEVIAAIRCAIEKFEKPELWQDDYLDVAWRVTNGADF